MAEIPGEVQGNSIIKISRLTRVESYFHPISSAKNKYISLNIQKKTKIDLYLHHIIHIFHEANRGI